MELDVPGGSETRNEVFIPRFETSVGGGSIVDRRAPRQRVSPTPLSTGGRRAPHARTSGAAGTAFSNCRWILVIGRGSPSTSIRLLEAARSRVPPSHRQLR